MRWIVKMAAAASLGVLSPAMAQEAAPANPCELHVWPAERMTSVTTGLLGGGLIDAMIHSGTIQTTRHRSRVRSTARASSMRCNRSISQALHQAGPGHSGGPS